MTIDNTMDIIDSRDVIERIAELESMDFDIDDEGTELAFELETLRAFAAEASGYCADWEYGGQLIRDSYFETYAQELADDIGAVPSDVSWPMTCIDWKQAARELQMDYTAIKFDGVTYWTR